MQSIDIAPDEKECMQQLFFRGPTWDGDIVSKAGRAGLHRRGYAERENGWTQLTAAGFVVAVRAGLGDDKERRDNKMRRASQRSGDVETALRHAVEIAEAKITGTWDDLLPYRKLLDQK